MCREKTVVADVERCDCGQKFNTVCDPGAAALAEAFKHIPGLQALDLVRMCVN